jgi:membrane fusion protein (multidrug efflux system)
MKLKQVVYALLILGFGAFITYRIIENKSKSSDSKENQIKKSPMKVTGILVKEETFDNILSLSGSIEANEQVEIRSEVSGIVESINFIRKAAWYLQDNCSLK